ncbi:MAG TPA: hypothetical protein DDX40_09465 [Rikenellaceae bacterium]|nr:hypothetical protein [Rikenellaceae bacterium]
MIENLKNRIISLLGAMADGAYERDEVIGLSLLAALSGESIFLLGVPGVGKSMVARRLKMAFRDSRSFEYLMSRFSTPDEIFGPVSISKLKDGDTYERVIDGYLPTADIVFLDEIWKAGPSIQNSLLTAINEKVFRNGDKDLKLPLKGIISASNELPAEGEGLEALWDRFLIRYIVRPIGDRLNFMALLIGNIAEPNMDKNLAFSDEEYHSLISRSRDIDVPESIMDYIYNLRALIIKQTQENNANDGDEHEIPYVSDRRWKKILGIMRMSALMNGRERVDYSDCLLMEHMIWDHDSQIPKVGKDICEELVKTIMKDSINRLNNKACPARNGQEAFFTPDGVHYIIEAGGESIRIRISDYKKLTPEAIPGRFAGNDLIDLVDSAEGDFLIKSPRGGAVAINNFVYRIRKKNAVAVSYTNASMSSQAVGSAGSMLAEFQRQVGDNVFLTDIQHYSLITRVLQKYNGGR